MSALADLSGSWFEEEITKFKPTQQKEIRIFFNSYDLEKSKFLKKIEQQIPPQSQKEFKQVKALYESQVQQSDRRIFKRFLELKEEFQMQNDRKTAWDKRVQALVEKTEHIVEKEKKLKQALEEAQKEESIAGYRKNAKEEIDDRKDVEMLAQEMKVDSEELAAMALAVRYFQSTEETEWAMQADLTSRYLKEAVFGGARVAAVAAMFGTVLSYFLSVSKSSHISMIVLVSSFFFGVMSEGMHRYLKSLEDFLPRYHSEKSLYLFRSSKKENRRIIPAALNKILAEMASSKSPQTAVDVLEKLQPTLERLGCHEKVRLRVDTEESSASPKFRVLTKENPPPKIRIDTGKETISEEFEELEVPANIPKRMRLPER